MFPKIPGVEFSSRVHKAYRADYGPEFATRGIVSKEPPEIGKPFPILVSAVDRDGNEIAGVRMPEQQVPLATQTGWNLFNENSGPTDELSNMQGSYIPFPRTEEERQAEGDPRPSVKKRYRSREEYLGLIADAGIRMIEEGYLLGKDLPEIVKRAGRHWDYLMGPQSPTANPSAR